MYVRTRQVESWEVILFPNGKDLFSSGKKGLNLDSGLPWGEGEGRNINKYYFVERLLLDGDDYDDREGRIRIRMVLAFN